MERQVDIGAAHAATPAPAVFGEACHPAGEGGLGAVLGGGRADDELSGGVMWPLSRAFSPLSPIVLRTNINATPPP